LAEQDAAARVPDSARALLEAVRFEVIPAPDVEERVCRALTGGTVTITTSARYGLERTVAVATRLAAEGFDAVPHLAAGLVRSRAELHELLGRLHEAHVREVFVVGGDVRSRARPYHDAGELIADVVGASARPQRIGIAGYPEGQPAIDDALLTAALRAKAPHAGSITTQMCFNHAAITRWAERLKEDGVELPVYVGAPGSVHTLKLMEIALRIGVGDSMKYLRGNRGVAARLLRGRGAFRCDDLVERVVNRAPANVKGFHLFTFNAIERTVDWWLELTRRFEAHDGG
jgi:methylenetetrahydrofolate reductase (NADPH)